MRQVKCVPISTWAREIVLIILKSISKTLTCFAFLAVILKTAYCALMAELALLFVSKIILIKLWVLIIMMYEINDYLRFVLVVSLPTKWKKTFHIKSIIFSGHGVSLDY